MLLAATTSPLIELTFWSSLPSFRLLDVEVELNWKPIEESESAVVAFLSSPSFALSEVADEAPPNENPPEEFVGGFASVLPEKENANPEFGVVVDDASFSLFDGVPNVKPDFSVEVVLLEAPKVNPVDGLSVEFALPAEKVKPLDSLLLLLGRLPNVKPPEETEELGPVSLADTEVADEEAPPEVKPPAPILSGADSIFFSAATLLLAEPPGFEVSQHGHLVCSGSFVTAHEGHFQLPGFACMNRASGLYPDLVLESEDAFSGAFAGADLTGFGSEGLS